MKSLLLLVSLAALLCTAFQPPAAPPAGLGAPPPNSCSVRCHPDDSLALVQIYNALDGLNWENTKRWDLNACVETWFGVLLDTNFDPARVVALDLDGDTGVVLSAIDGYAPGIKGLSGTFPGSLQLPRLRLLSLNSNPFSNVAIKGPFPNFSTLPQLVGLGLNYAKMNGPLPSDALPPSLEQLYLEEAGLTGVLPDASLDLPNLVNIDLKGNPGLTDPLPQWAQLGRLQSIAFSRCNFEGVVPGYGHLPAGLLNLFCPFNRFTFEDILPNWAAIKKHAIKDFDSLQLFSVPATRQVAINCPFRWDVGIDDTVATSTYRWFQNGILRSTTDSNTLFVKEMPADWGGTWVCKVTNSIVTEVEIESHPLTVTLCQPEIMDIDTALCPGQSLTVRGVLYNEQNPMGKQQLIGKATNGCDSVIRVQLRYPLFRAGPDTFMCQNNLPLRAGLPPGANGLWTAAPAALITDPTAPLTAASGLQAGETRFFWTVTFVGCPPATDTFAVFFDQPPTALPDSVTIFIDKNGSGNFLLNDLFFDPAKDVISVLPLPPDGDFDWDDDGDWTFDPDKLYSGTYIVRYSLCSTFCPPEYCDTAEIKIKVVPEVQPEFVSANGDGINDVLVIKALAADPTAFPDNELLIYSADGSKVCCDQGYRNDWPSLGKLPPPGTFWFFFRQSPDDPVVPGILLLTH